MQLYMYVDTGGEGPELEEIQNAVTQSIAKWVSQESIEAKLIYPEIDNDEVNLGIELEIKAKSELKEPLKFLNTLAKSHKCDFVIGILDSQDNSREDICYFGHNEGTPDAYEVANYLEL